jgi:hypothetical protein
MLVVPRTKLKTAAEFLQQSVIRSDYAGEFLPELLILTDCLCPVNFNSCSSPTSRKPAPMRAFAIFLLEQAHRCS